MDNKKPLMTETHAPPKATTFHIVNMIHFTTKHTMRNVLAASLFQMLSTYAV